MLIKNGDKDFYAPCAKYKARRKKRLSEPRSQKAFTFAQTLRHFVKFYRLMKTVKAGANTNPNATHVNKPLEAPPHPLLSNKYVAD